MASCWLSGCIAMAWRTTSESWADSRSSGVRKMSSSVSPSLASAVTTAVRRAVVYCSINAALSLSALVLASSACLAPCWSECVRSFGLARIFFRSSAIWRSSSRIRFCLAMGDGAAAMCALSVEDGVLMSFEKYSATRSAGDWCGSCIARSARPACDRPAPSANARACAERTCAGSPDMMASLNLRATS